MKKNDPGEDLNVRKVHGQILREHSEPKELLKRIPAWLKHFYAVLSFWFAW